jgi:cysteine-rich repeat protein
VCGDFAWDEFEECDDLSFGDGDGCDSRCRVESTETRGNNRVRSADDYADGPYYGRISSRSDVDHVRVVVPADSAYLIANTYSLAVGGCEGGMFDPHLTLMASGRSVIATNDDYDGTCSRLVARDLQAGEYIIAVEESPKSTAPRSEFPYELDVSVDWCGNAVWGPLEGCDDGNTVSGDGCSADCKDE